MQVRKPSVEWVREWFPHLENVERSEFDDVGAPGVRFYATSFESGDAVRLHLLRDSGHDGQSARIDRRASLRHPQVATIFDHGRVAGYHYVIESVPAGRCLAGAVASAEISRAEVLVLVPKITHVIQQLASRGVELSTSLQDIYLSDSGEFTLMGLVEGSKSPNRPLSSIEAHPTIGTRIGGYHLLKQIGEGGFAEVYQAMQEHPMRREVALKILKLGMDSRQVLARFARERDALAQLNHRGIARIYDAGATAAGRPYIVMELVDGQPITEYCDSLNLDLAHRLLLLAQVCQAVHYGHQIGVIHRDLKPSNILVAEEDGKPAAKVIDFGIARAVEEPLATDTFYTRTQQLVGSPSYMSPEQVDGAGNLDARSDVYGLGCVLYELLVGEPPLPEERIQKMGLSEVLDRIQTSSIEHPADRFASKSLEQQLRCAASRKSERTSLRNTLAARGVSEVVLKALSRNPRDRYETPAALAEDLQRWTDQATVLAPRRRRLAFRRTQRALIWLALLVALIGAIWYLQPPARLPAVSRASDGTIRPVALFQFDGTLDSAIPNGPPMEAMGGPALNFVQSRIADQEAHVLHFPRFQKDQWLKFENTVGINGPPDATETNRWTLVIDVMFPKITGPIAQFQCHSENGGAAEVYVGNVRSGSRHFFDPSIIREGEWNRLVIASSDNGRTQFYTTYVNGTRLGGPRNVGLHSASYAFCDEILLFSDGEEVGTAEGYVNSVAFYDLPLTDTEVAALGPPSSNGIPHVLKPQAASAEEGGVPIRNRIELDDGHTGDYFGHALAMHDEMVWISASEADSDSTTNTGLLYQYRLASQGSWEWTRVLNPPADTPREARFGQSLALSSQHLIVGSTGVGQCHLYRKADDWNQAIPLVPTKPWNHNGYAYDVALGENAAIVAAPCLHRNLAMQNGGAVFVFDLETGLERQVLTATDDAEDKQFGRRLAISRDTLAVGSIKKRDERSETLGPIELFQQGADGEWKHSFIIERSGKMDGPEDSLALSPDATRLAVTGGMGQVHVYERAKQATWQFQHELTLPDAAEHSVAVNALSFVSSSRLLVGAAEGLWRGNRTGVVYVYDWGGEEWILQRTVAPTMGGILSGFGGRLANHGNRLWAGCPYDSMRLKNQGAAYPVWLPRFEDQKFQTVSVNPWLGSGVSVSGKVAAVGSPGVDQRVYRGELQVFQQISAGRWERMWHLEPTPSTQRDWMPISDYSKVAVDENRLVTMTPTKFLVMNRPNQPDEWRILREIERQHPRDVSMDSEGNILLSYGSRTLEIIPFDGAKSTVFRFRTPGRNYSRPTIHDGLALAVSDRAEIVSFRRSEGASFTQQFSLPFPPSIPRKTEAGSALDHDSVRCIVGHSVHTDQFRDQGHGMVHVYELTTPGELPVTLECPEPGDMGAFGFSVAIRGDIALVGNPYVRNGQDPGRVYVYTRDAMKDHWECKEILQASNATAGDEFGCSIAFDEGWAIIGAKSEWVYFFRID